MIRKLRVKFIRIAMLSLAGTLLLVLAAINISNFYISIGRTDAVIDMLYSNDGGFPSIDWKNRHASDAQMRQETPFETRYFIAYLDEEGEIIKVDLEHVAAVERPDIDEYVKQIAQGKKVQGFIDQYRYHVYDTESGSMVIVVDIFLQIQAVTNVLFVSGVAALACIVIVFVLLQFISKKAVRPFIENMEKQHQFVTDASHELKTPLTIISANTDLLEMELGENEWIESTKTQTHRLSRLIKNLIELASAEEQIPEEEQCVFDLSELVSEAADAFEPAMHTRMLALKTDIEPGIRMTGLNESVYRLLTILLDNAAKYADEGTWVHVSLTRAGRQSTVCVANPAKDADPAKVSKYFDRFYRADPSRARETGGFGIGLSVAHAIAERHGAKISARCESGVIYFAAVFSIVENSGH